MEMLTASVSHLFRVCRLENRNWPDWLGVVGRGWTELLMFCKKWHNSVFTTFQEKQNTVIVKIFLSSVLMISDWKCLSQHFCYYSKIFLALLVYFRSNNLFFSDSRPLLSSKMVKNADLHLTCSGVALFPAFKTNHTCQLMPDLGDTPPNWLITLGVFSDRYTTIWTGHFDLFLGV